MWLDIGVTETQLAAPPRSARATSWSIFGAFVVGTMARGTGAFAYDAYGYWTAAQRIVGTSPVSPEFFWALRGVLAGFVYVPAAMLSKIIGPQTAGFSVLLQNSLVLAGAAAFLVPSFLNPWRELSARSRWSSAFLVWLAVGGFARYPLIDVYAAIACLVVVVMLRRGGARLIAAAGLVGGVALNLRPAYLVTIILIAVVVLLWHRWTGLLFAAGAAVSLIPQVAFNVIRFATWSISPAGSGGMVGLQAGLASYIVRYDTLLGAQTPAKFYCSPDMAREVGTAPPLSMSQLATFFLDHFPHASPFALEKVAASLHWTLLSPYATPTPGLDVLFALFVTAVTVVGLANLIRMSIQKRGTLTRHGWFTGALTATLVVGAVLTLVSSATETRFALPLVLLGLIGCATFGDVSPRAAWAQHRRWIVGSVIVTVGVVALGYLGLSHPVRPGPVDVSVCSES